MALQCHPIQTLHHYLLIGDQLIVNNCCIAFHVELLATRIILYK